MEKFAEKSDGKRENYRVRSNGKTAEKSEI